MKRVAIGRLVAAMATAAVLLPATANAQATIKVNDDVWFRFGLLMQGWGDWNQLQTKAYAENLYLRRDRLLVTGSVAPGVTFFFQTDDPNLGKSPKSLTTGFVVQDAWMEWKIADAFAIDAGKFLVPLNRDELVSVSSFVTLDISPTSTVFVAPTGSDANRDTGVQIKGYLIDGGHLEYRYAVMQGLRSTDSRNGFRNSAYLQYDFFDTEKGYTYAGTNLGKRKILGISAGYDGQSNYHSYGGAAFTTLPVGVGDELALSGQWDHYDGNTFIKALPRQNDYLVEAGYYLSAVKLQPFGKWEQQKFVADAQMNNDITRWGGGFHYYVYGQNLKLSAQYQRIMPKAPLKDTNELTLAMQVWYY
jgi:Phosphate-selective porin O and P